ncbi:MAG TPA: T9SS sorting signal type C domain-containing protein, partial [Flavobacterium sp.]|uniref:T9SS sorting signal type C domain-containing protein n=1 Tax=Flavobacterium sp. TaxID=239 RepID=UPI002ED6B6F2
YLSYTGTGWKTEAPITTVMIPGKGYGIRTPKAKLWPNGENVVFPYSQPVQFIGVPNNGTISGGAVVAGNSYLIGNPYPCAIDADTFLFANLNNSAILEGTLYFWTHNTDVSLNGGKYSSADYASYNGIGGTMTLPAASGGSVPNGKIAAGQSFFAKATNNGSVVFNNEMRISGDNHHFFKPAKSSKSNAFERHRLWLNMTNTGGAFKQLLIGYIQGATNGFDSDFDGISLNANAFIDFYSINLGSNLVIQGRALPFTDSDLVPLGYSTIIEGEFTISIGQADGKLGNQPVYLEDKLTNTINDLRVSDYTFKTNTGIFNNRFVLRYTNKTLGTDDFESDNNVLVWIDNKNIKLHSAKENIHKVFIYDISGRLIYNNSAISTSGLTISNLKFKDEVLLAKIVLTNNHIITKKIITTSK